MRKNRRAIAIRDQGFIHYLSYPLVCKTAKSIRYLFALLMFFAMPFTSVAAEPKRTRLCPTVVFEGDQVALTDTEVRLACGDQTRDQLGRPWSEVPIWQAKYLLKTFFQERGYLNAEFSERDKVLVVRTGKPTVVTSLTARGAPDDFNLPKRRGIVGSVLTPKLLTETENWSIRTLQAIGYPCPVVKAEGDSASGAVVLNVEPGPKQNFASLLAPAHPEMDTAYLWRYNAFSLGEKFNGDLLSVTERRVLDRGLVQSIHLGVSCEKAGALIRQEVMPGQPRLITVGFGANTEGLLLAKITWSNTRLGKGISSFDVAANASARDQQLNASAQWYYLPYPSRRFIAPFAGFRHRNELYFETLSLTGRITPGTTWESDGYGGQARVGPAIEYIKTLRGDGPANSKFLSLEAGVTLLSHNFEFYRTSPRKGFELDAAAAINRKGWFSDASAQRLRIRGESLLNYKSFDPPLFVVGLRGAAATTVTGERPGPDIKIPPSFRQYLGGSLDLRGFARQELPSDGLGSLSSAFAGVELRLNGQLPLGFEPFMFLDGGALGNEPFSLDSPVYLSPGIGLRWESPVGIFRTSLARGFVLGQVPAGTAQPAHFQLYLSLGEEF